MKSSREPADSERLDSSKVPRLSSIPRHIEEWLDSFFDGRPTVRFTCTPRFYDAMYLRLREAAVEHDYDPDLIVDTGGTLEFRRRPPGQPQRTYPELPEPTHNTPNPEQRLSEPPSPEELISRLESLRDQIKHVSAHRQELACTAVAAGIKKSQVYSNAGVTPPTLDKWLREGTAEKGDHKLERRLILRRLQIANHQIRSSVTELRRLATETAIVIGDVSKVARAAGLSRQAIYRWLKLLSPTDS